MTITLLVQNAPPRKICEEVRQCPKALQPVKNIAGISAAPLQQPDEKCSLCKWLITWVDDKLKENHTEVRFTFISLVVLYLSEVFQRHLNIICTPCTK